MAFNHYAKIKRILDDQPAGWFIKRIDEPTSAKKFNGETVQFDHYYRVFDYKGQQLKYCKFQQIERLSKILNIPIEELTIVS